MRRSPSPPLRWVRRTFAFAPVAGLSLVFASVFPVRLTVIDAVTLPACVVALLVAGWLARGEVLAERHATPMMAARCQALQRLLEKLGDNELLIDPQDQVAILLVDERRKDGCPTQAFLRFDRDELEQAGED